MKKVIFFVIILICNIYCFSQNNTNKKYQVYEDALIQLISIMDSIFPNQDTLTYFFEKSYGITDCFPSYVKKHKVKVLNLREIYAIIQLHPLSVWRMYPLIIEDKKFKIRIVENSVSKFGNPQGMIWGGGGLLDFVYVYDFYKELFIFEKGL